jgi:hypothetical protein
MVLADSQHCVDSFDSDDSAFWGMYTSLTRSEENILGGRNSETSKLTS